MYTLSYNMMYLRKCFGALETSQLTYCKIACTCDLLWEKDTNGFSEAMELGNCNIHCPMGLS